MIRFKYSLTLAVEEYGSLLFTWFFAIVFCVLIDKINPFKYLLYYGFNILGLVLGWHVGLFLSIILVEWMRKKTVWAGEWEEYFGNEDEFFFTFDELGCIIIGVVANILFIFTAVNDYIDNSSLEGLKRSSLVIISIFALQILAYRKASKRKSNKRNL